MAGELSGVDSPEKWLENFPEVIAESYIFLHGLCSKSLIEYQSLFIS